MIKQEDVTIIVPHLGGSKESEYALNQCLLSLKETVPTINIVLAINGKFLCQGHDGLDDLSNVIMITRQGQCGAVNAAVAMTNTPWIFVTNDDMVYAPGWFEKLIEPIKRRFLVDGDEIDVDSLMAKQGGLIQVNEVQAVKELPEILCISPMLVEPRSGAPTFRVQFFGGAGGDFNKQGWIDFAADWAVPEDLRTGFNLPFLINRDLWDLVGGYDINFDPWSSNSDSDLLYKIKLAGVQPYQNTNCVVYHFSQTSGTFEPRNQDAWQKNWDYFIEKWGFPRTDEGIWEASFSIPNEGRLFRPEWEGKYGN